tara:strand:+ start:20 stop:214 length:195 start_codon:yes stop_codon:yes gene_type:complete
MRISGICRNHGYYKGEYCLKCRDEKKDSKWTTNLYMISNLGKRTDIEFTPQTMDESIANWRSDG